MAIIKQINFKGYTPNYWVVTSYMVNCLIPGVEVVAAVSLYNDAQRYDDYPNEPIFQLSVKITGEGELNSYDIQNALIIGHGQLLGYEGPEYVGFFNGCQLAS